MDRDTIDLLMKFYGVDTMEALVEAQRMHVRRLEDRLAKYESGVETRRPNDK
jgi:hypothetical protein